MDHRISLQEAVEMTSNFRSSTPAGMAYAEKFDAASVKAVLSQPGCISLRIYYGRRVNNTVHAIIVGVDTNGNDIVSSSITENNEGIILEDGVRCPPTCSGSGSSLLNP